MSFTTLVETNIGKTYDDSRIDIAVLGKNCNLHQVVVIAKIKNQVAVFRYNDMIDNTKKARGFAGYKKCLKQYWILEDEEEAYEKMLVCIGKMVKRSPTTWQFSKKENPNKTSMPKLDKKVFTTKVGEQILRLAKECRDKQTSFLLKH